LKKGKRSPSFGRFTCNTERKRTGLVGNKYAGKSMGKTTISIGRKSHSVAEPAQAELVSPSGDNEHTSSSNDDTHQICIYVLEDDELFSEILAAQLQQYGYMVSTFSTTELLMAAVREHAPMLIISDIELDDGTSTDFFNNHDERDIFKDIPIIFLSSYTDFYHRLETVRAGAAAYFLKPVDINALTEKIDKLTHRQKEEPFKVLLVDDSKTQTQIITQILKTEGMIVNSTNEPDKTIDLLTQFRPDAVMLDINMPGCSGIELAEIIRQFESFVGIPIIYLSTESALEKQVEALKVGGDHFITKPINPPQLITTVSSRVHRYRAMRNLMMRDSLTGLYNHTTTEEKVQHETNRAQRTGASFVFAMIDIDHFKNVNDTYGHPTGDRVIKSLAMLLRQRLRTTDIVGRYGGEEFAVALLDTSLANATTILNEIRETFSQITYQTENGAFSCSFSCGLAEYPTHQTVVGLNDAADKALYVAKNNGRNQVVVDGEKN
jgi:diguanylate cyclase (GGDEF)-like protein